MKIYIQSKSGNNNSDSLNVKAKTLPEALKELRREGGYFADGIDGRLIRYVPFEEVEFIREAE